MKVSFFMQQKHYDLAAILDLPRRYRGTLLNYLSGFKSANLIGTKSENGRTNLAIFNSVVHIGANPPFLGFILRPTTVERHTYENIQATSFYTINAISKAFYDKAHQTSAKYPRGQSEFEAVDLNPIYKDDFHAPYVAESPIQMGMQLEEVHPIECNGTYLVVGKMLHLYLPNESVGENGHFDLSEHDVVSIGGLYTYYSAQKLERLPYAKASELTKKE
jgi:flavin reductase (DIM6/NTAB) family NADH-FMN oxidoreductase RutF